MKKTRLLEIIREEIANALSEMSYAGVKAIPDMKNDPSYKTLNQIGKIDAEKELKSGGTVELEEEQLNEAPIYDVNDIEGFKSTLNKFRDENVSKSKALNLLLTKLENEGTVDTNQLSKDMGVDTATFNNQEIRKFLNRPEDEFFENPKTGKELLDFTPFLTKLDKKRGRVAGEKIEKEPKMSEPKMSEPKMSEPKMSEPKMSEPKMSEPKMSDIDKAATMASKTPKLDKLAGNQSALLKALKQAEEERLKIAEKRRNTEDVTEREKLLNDLKQINKLEGELRNKLEANQDKIDKSFR